MLLHGVVCFLCLAFYCLACLPYHLLALSAGQRAIQCNHLLYSCNGPEFLLPSYSVDNSQRSRKLVWTFQLFLRHFIDADSYSTSMAIARFRTALVKPGCW
jgi:hypothetical protein